MSQITWLNSPSKRSNGVFISARATRDADGQHRLNIYFSRRAVAALGLRGGERMLVGADVESRRLFMKPTLFGGNALKRKEDRADINLLITLPSTKPLPDPVLIDEESVDIAEDMFSIPYPTETIL